MQRPIKCKWCGGTGTIGESGYAPRHVCQDCAGTGYVFLCPLCGTPLSCDAGHVVGDELWCDECFMKDREAEDGS